MTSLPQLVLLLLLLLTTSYSTTAAFEWSTGGRPAIDRRAIAGVWSLKPKPAYPMKEFTVYPKTSNKDDDQLLLMLKEDGSFQQCQDDQLVGSEKEDAAAVDIDASWSKFQKIQTSQKQKDALHHQLLHGTWDLVDGKLILAADRIQPKASDDIRQQARQERSSGLASKNKKDTLLVGRVVANYETRLQDNPVLPTTTTQDDDESSSSKQQQQQQEASSEQQQQQNKARSRRPQSSSKKKSTIALDTHLSVPKGSVKVGRFFYPRNHPSFFEQPMFQPKRQGSFSLRQVLGSLNTGLDDDDEEPQELFLCSDFYNKTFTLTSHPISYKPKGKMRWSIRQNKMIRESVSQDKLDAAAANAEKTAANIRVMLVQFHANNTFSTLAGLGESTVLRGKFDIIGRDKDQLWMQIWRFGFGRSVSGSVYSEGRMLTQEDAKTYWGTIRYEQEEKDEAVTQQTDAAVNDPVVGEQGAVLESSDSSKGDEEKDDDRLEVKGSVMFGWGIEPTPEARFIMREATSEDLVGYEEEEEEDDDEEDDDDIELSLGGDDDSPPNIGNDGIDWSSEGSFQ